MNRNERRALGRRMRAAGRVVLVLKGGPMNGWLVKEDAPCLQPDWRDKYLEAAAEQIYRNEPRGWLKKKWEKVPEHEKIPFREQAKALFGTGYYKADSTGTEATWVVD